MTGADRRIRVMCVENETEMIDLVTVILGRSDIEVVGATSGEEGLEAMVAHKPDLVLLDLMMPEMDGWEVVKLMRADDRLHQVPVIVVSALGGIDKTLGLKVAKVNDYIVKPFAPDELVTSVEKVLSGGASAPAPA